MSSLTTRRAVPADLPALQVLYQQLDDVHALAEPDVVPTHDQAPRAVTDVERQLVDDIVFVASLTDEDGIDGAVVGFARIQIVDLGAYFLFPKVAEVDDLSVLEGKRGRGIGKRLMLAAEAWAIEAGYPELWVSAWTFNEPAAGLYRQQGFVPLSTRFRKRLATTID